jgi:hypothetical protein
MYPLGNQTRRQSPDAVPHLPVWIAEHPDNSNHTRRYGCDRGYELRLAMNLASFMKPANHHLGGDCLVYLDTSWGSSGSSTSKKGRSFKPRESEGDNSSYHSSVELLDS